MTQRPTPPPQLLLHQPPRPIWRRWKKGWRRGRKWRGQQRRDCRPFTPSWAKRRRVCVYVCVFGMRPVEKNASAALALRRKVSVRSAEHLPPSSSFSSAEQQQSWFDTQSGRNSKAVSEWYSRTLASVWHRKQPHCCADSGSEGVKWYQRRGPEISSGARCQGIWIWVCPSDTIFPNPFTSRFIRLSAARRGVCGACVS